MNLKFLRRVSERERAIRQLVIVRKQIYVSLECVCPVIDNEFLYNIVKVVCESTRLSQKREMLWEHEPQASVSTVLSRMFLFNK